mgnify:CR=1 FL=1
MTRNKETLIKRFESTAETYEKKGNRECTQRTVKVMSIMQKLEMHMTEPKETEIKRMN